MAQGIRVLHVLGNTQLGGAESRVMDLYRHMDRERVRFDFLVHTEKEGHFDKEIKAGRADFLRSPFSTVQFFFLPESRKKFF